MSRPMSKVGRVPHADVITIERRDVIARIEHDPMGEESMLQVSYKVACDYLTENSNSEPISLEWEYGSGTFTAGYVPRES